MTKSSKQEKKKPCDTHLNVTLKLAYHRMFWLVSGKGQRRPFCPNDKWAELTGHLSLPLSLTLSLLPSILSSFSYISTSNPKPQFVPSVSGPGDWFHQVTDLSVSARGKTPQTLCNARRPTAGGDEIEAPFITAGVPLKGSSYISPQQETLSAFLRKLLSLPCPAGKLEFSHS